MASTGAQFSDRWHNGKVSLVNDPQIWTLLAVFAAIMLGGMTLMTTLLIRSMNAAIEGVNGKFDGVHGRIGGLAVQFDGLDARFDAVNARIDGLAGEMRAQFDTVNVKLEYLDRDVTALSKKVFGDPGD